MSSDKPICVYCGKAAGATTDHVPPKLLFPPPRPGNLVTVPACRACNQSFQRDDEYFRAMMLLRRDIAEQPEAKALMPTFYRSWERSRGEQFAKSVAKTFHMREWLTLAGLYAGTSPAFVVEDRRMRRVYERIIRGLYYHETGQRIPDDHAVEVTLWVEEKPHMMKLLPAYLGGRPVRKIGGVFTYGFVMARDVPGASLWLTNFYRSALAVTRTVPKELLQATLTDRE